MTFFYNFVLVMLMIDATTRVFVVTSFESKIARNVHIIQNKLPQQQEFRIPRRRRRLSKYETNNKRITITSISAPSSLLSASLASTDGDADGELDPLYVAGEALSSVTNAAVDSISNAISDEPDFDAIDIARKQELVQRRKLAKTYKVTLPLTSSSSTFGAVVRPSLVLSMGITLCQISNGRNVDSSFELDLDTLKLKDRTQRITDDDDDESNSIDVDEIRKKIDGEFQGLIVSSVKQGSAGWVAGVRSGDTMKASSATLGNNMWPKSTLDGVKSALLSRKAVAESVQFEFQRLGETVDNEYELTLTKPIGLNLKETEDGYVEITGFTPKASKLIRHAVRVGDRVVAVDSSLGDRMWPVSKVEGVISAVTARLPGQQITFRFERSDTNTMDRNYGIADTSAVVDKSRSNSTDDATTMPTDFAGATNSVLNDMMDGELLNRCQEVMKRYMNDEKYVNKFSLPSVVADKVVYALASAETPVDAVTLSMILTAYLSCKQPQMVIRVFEAVVGLRADGMKVKVKNALSTSSTNDPLMGKNGKQIIPNVNALNVYTVGALIKAHAMNGDIDSVQTVWSALEGSGGASWPGTGPHGSLQPDRHCYNIAISAAGNSDTDEGLKVALKLFDALPTPVPSVSYKNSNTGRIEKDIVSYNSIIKTLSDCGKFEEAIEKFYEMKKVGIKPDKYTYTALAKSVMSDDDNDVEELLFDMREEGPDYDAKTFNIIIRYLCKRKKMNAAKKVVNWMEASGVLPDSWTYGFLMTGLLKSGNPRGALTLFESASSDRRTTGLTENVYLYTTAITAAASVGDYKCALELVTRMNSLGISPNAKTMTALLTACITAEESQLAVDIFRRIPKPDSYAVTKGLLAMSQAGSGDEALHILSEKESVAGRIQGKQLNNIYQSLLRDAINQNNFILARRVVMSLLGKGNIPSKAMYQVVFECMDLTFSKGLARHMSYASGGLVPVQPKSLDVEDVEKFLFLLFLVDSLSDRNLPCEAPLYATILAFGHQLGDLPKKVSALMVSANAHSGLYSDRNMKFLDEGSCDETACLIGGWEDLYKSFDELRHQIEGPSSLPELRVRISSSELSRVLNAEKYFSYRKRSLV